MVKINEVSTLEYFSANNAVAISPEEALIAIENLEDRRLEMAYYREEAFTFLTSQPSTWPQIA